MNFQKLVVVACGLAVLLLSSAPPAAAVSIWLDLDASTPEIETSLLVAPGAQIDARVVATGIPRDSFLNRFLLDFGGLKRYEAKFFFPNDVLNVISVDTDLNNIFGVDLTANRSWVIEQYANDLPWNPAWAGLGQLEIGARCNYNCRTFGTHIVPGGSGVLANITFEAVGVGQALLQASPADTWMKRNAGILPVAYPVTLPYDLELVPSGIAVIDAALPFPDPGGPYQFRWDNLTISLDASGSFDPNINGDPDPSSGLSQVRWFTRSEAGIWRHLGSRYYNPGIHFPPDKVDVSILWTALSSTTDTEVIQLRIRDVTGGEAGANTTVSYRNSAPQANAGANLLFDASHFINNGFLLASKTADGSASTDPDMAVNALISGFESFSLQWSGGQSPSSAINEVTVADAVSAGMTTTTSTGALLLDATDAAGATGQDVILLQWDNVAPTVHSTSATEHADLSMAFDVEFLDADRIVNFFTETDFELLQLEISRSDVFGSVGDVILSSDTTSGGGPFDLWFDLTGTLDRATLESFFDGPGTFTVHANVRDRAGATASVAFDITMSVPEPASIVQAALALFLFSLLAHGHRRRRT